MPLRRYPQLEVGLCTLHKWTLVCVYALYKARLKHQHRIPQLQTLCDHFAQLQHLKECLSRAIIYRARRWTIITWEWLKWQVCIKSPSRVLYLWAPSVVEQTLGLDIEKNTSAVVSHWILSHLIFLLQLMEDLPDCLKKGLCTYSQPTAYSVWDTQQ